MGWIVEFVVQMVAQFFGEAIGKDQPWWVGVLASLGCLLLLGLIALPFWLLFALRP